MTRGRTALAGLGIFVMLVTGSAAPAQTSGASAQECATMWKAADANKDGSLTEQELEKFKAIMAKVDTNKDGKISESEFMAACQKGDLKDVNK